MQRENIGVRTSEVLLPPAAPVLSDEPIDAVVTWVDGSDPAHREKREAALKALGKSPSRSGIITAGKHLTRFTDNGEIRWCLHSIRTFAPWIRHIHLVTDNQVPAFLTPTKQRELGVRIVDHTEIFRGYEWALPTFNSRSIETMIWRIKGLAERFVYLNDDFVLTRPWMQSELFSNGQVVIRGEWSRVRRSRFLEHCRMAVSRVCGIPRTGHLAAQTRAAQLIAPERVSYFKIFHAPHPVFKGTAGSFFSEHPHLLEQNITPQFRDQRQFWAISLFHHLMLEAGLAVVGDPSACSMVCGGKTGQRAVAAEIEKIKEGENSLLCIQSMERLSPMARDQLGAFLDLWTATAVQ